MADRKEYFKAYYQAHKEQYREYGRKWRANNPEKSSEANHKQYLKRKKAKADGEKENQSST